MNEEKEKERRLGFAVGDWGAARVNDDEELGSSTETPVQWSLETANASSAGAP